jgi:hypothetical protein
MGGKRERSREERPSRQPFTWYSSADPQSGSSNREEVRASARGPLRNSTAPQMDDKRRGHNEVLVRATREDSRTTATRF